MNRGFSIHDKLALYATGTLPYAEMIAFDDHLQRCHDCQTRAPRLFAAAAELIPDSPPPERVWTRIVSAIEKR
ncbi:MAG: zf-HC2 domain-containing protein [Actinomycetota bacterium]